MKKTAIVVLLFFMSHCVPAQTTAIDSLKGLLQRAAAPAEEANLLLALLKEDESLNAPSVWAYSNRLFTLGTLVKNDDWQFRALYYKVKYDQKLAKLQEAVELCDSVMDAVKNTPLKRTFYPMFANSKSFILVKQNKFTEALAAHFDVLRFAEEIRDTLSQMRIKNGIGLVYMEMEQHRDAIGWFLRSLQTTTNTDYLKKAVPVYSNLASNYSSLHQNDSALYYISTSLRLAEAAQNFDYLANAYFILSGIYIDEKKFAAAEQAQLKGLYYRKQTGDPFFVVSDLMQMGIFYAQSGQPEKGIAVCLAGIDSAKRYKLDEKLPVLYDALAQNYKAQKNYPQYAETLQQLLALKDSTYKKASAEALAELQTRYDLQKKETLITQQQLALVRKNYLVYGSAALLLILLTITFFLFKNYRNRQRLKLRLLQEEESRKADKAVLLAEEAERKRIAADLHDSLGAYATSIASNVENLQSRTGDRSLLQELKGNVQSIVSQLGDTIWVLKRESQTLTAISDRAKLFIQRLAISYPDVLIDVKEDLATDYALPAAQAFHLFQIMKEAVVNALRHSHCRQITVMLQSRDGWHISITDDGQGLGQNTILAEGGNGLQNMKARAAESGWKIEWQPNAPRGTTVVVSDNNEE